jgi:hypothetical protein
MANDMKLFLDLFMVCYEDDQTNEIQWVGHAAHNAETRNTHKILVEKPDEKRPFERLAYTYW